jgi:hypothetical protein
MEKKAHEATADRDTIAVWLRTLCFGIRLLSILLGLIVFAVTSGMSVRHLSVLSDYQGPGIAVVALSLGLVAGFGTVAHCFRIAAGIQPEPQ